MISKIIELAHFIPLVSFYTPWKHQETRVFFMFPGDIERDQSWNELIVCYFFPVDTLHKKWSFPLRMCSDTLYWTADASRRKQGKSAVKDLDNWFGISRKTFADLNFEILKFVNCFARTTFGSFTKRCLSWSENLPIILNNVKTGWKGREVLSSIIY